MLMPDRNAKEYYMQETAEESNPLDPPTGVRVWVRLRLKTNPLVWEFKLDNTCKTMQIYRAHPTYRKSHIYID